MELVSVLKFLHVGAAFATVAIQLASDLYLQRVLLTGDTHAAATLMAAIRRRRWWEGAILEIAIVLGLATALLGGFDILAGWLLLAYLAIALLMVNGIRWAAPTFTAIHEAATADDRELMLALANGRRRRLQLAVSAVLFGTIIFLMVVKPIR